MAGFTYHDLGQIRYEDALQLQTSAFDTLLEAKRRGVVGENKLFFCEHNPVLTLGKSANEANLLIPEELLRIKGVSLYHINRGGDITYHGPGQITGYPVFDLEQWNMGLKQYIFTLEEIMICFLKQYGLRGERLEGAAGVWLDTDKPGRTRKICAIGVKSSRYVTMHGFALNINTDLSYYSLINPCGFTDKGVTSLQHELDRMLDFQQIKDELKAIFAAFF